MAQNNNINPKSKFDFVGPAKVEFTSGFSLGEQKKNIEQKFSETKKNKQSKSLVSIITLIALALACLCGYTVWMLRETNNQMENSSQISKSTPINPFVISWDTASIVLDSQPTETFVKTSGPSKMDLLDGKKSTLSSYLNSTSRDGKDLISGIEINSSEYDNKLSQDSFVDKVLENLGSEYSKGTDKIYLPKGFFTNKIISKSNSNLAYYPVVSSDNYYIIKVKNDAKTAGSNLSTPKFVDELINKTYLN